MTPFGTLVQPAKMGGMKLYVITRRDLSPGAQAVQSCHVLWQFAYEQPDIGRSWFVESNTLALLTVANESELIALIQRAEDMRVRFAIFKEPDYHNALTALALEPGPRTRKLVAGLPLTLRAGQK